MEGSQPQASALHSSGPNGPLRASAPSAENFSDPVSADSVRLATRVLRESDAPDAPSVIEELSQRQVEIEIRHEELLQTQRQLKVAKQQFQDLWEKAPVGYFIHLENGLLINANARAASLLDLDEHSFGSVSLWSRIATESFADYYQHMQRLRSGQELVSTEIRFNVNDRTAWCRLESEFVSGPTLQTAIVDLTREREQEQQRKRLEQQLQQAQKMDLAGRLSGGLAHDFNNILQSILIQTELGKELGRQGADASECFEHIVNVAQRGTTLVSRLLSLSRNQPTVSTCFNLADSVHKSVELLRSLIGDRIELRLDLPDRPLWIEGDSGQLDQILLNLCVNSRDAMCGQGRLHVTLEPTCIRHPDEELPNLIVGPAPIPGNYARLSVCDSGPGISHKPELLFEPFFSTKEPELGTGLGLAVVANVVAIHEGVIEVHNQPQGGACFAIYLPAIDRLADD